MVHSHVFYSPGASTVREDAWYADDTRGIYLVADGSTRSVEPGSPYPMPSPARQAAERFIAGLATALAQHTSAEMDPLLFRQACHLGNRRVRDLNEELGFLREPDYWTRDLAGTVFSGIVVPAAGGPETFLWAYLTDCGVARLTAEGKLAQITPDELAGLALYPPGCDLTDQERMMAIRRRFRNQPRAPRGTYGVVTGEEEVFGYLRIELDFFGPGEILVVFSDGARPLLLDASFRSLLVSGEAAGVQAAVDTFVPPSGERTIIRVAL